MGVRAIVFIGTASKLKEGLLRGEAWACENSTTQECIIVKELEGGFAIKVK